MQECYNTQHKILPVNSSEFEGMFVPRKTLCVTCFANRFDTLPMNIVLVALQDVTLLLQQSFFPLVTKRSAGLMTEDLIDNAAEPQISPLLLWRSLLSFYDVFLQLAGKLCVLSSLNRHVPLYRATLALLSLLFTLLKEFTGYVFPSTAEDSSFNGDSLGMTELDNLNITDSVHIPLAGLARSMCDAVHTGIMQEGCSPAGLLLLSDLAEMSPVFLQVLSEHCVSSVCAFAAPLRDAYRVELALYLLYQVFETCRAHPVWLEGLAKVLSTITSYTSQGGSFLHYLAWALETFRDDEPVVVNALCLSRFIATFETTRRALLFLRVGDGYNGPSSGTPPGLLRNLTLLLLHLNADVVVAAAETLRELIIVMQSLGECPDVADYVIESLRTVSADSAIALVYLLNVLPSKMIPVGPTLRIIFELAAINGKAFEEALKGPHFLAFVTDCLTNVHEVAQQVVHNVQNGGYLSLHSFMLQVLALESACGGTDIGGSALLPETVSVMANTLLHLLGDSCGAVPTEDEIGEDQCPFTNRFVSLPGETLRGVARGAAFLLPYSREALLHLSAELLGEALRQFLESGLVPLDSQSFFADNGTGDVLLILSATVLEYIVDERRNRGSADRFIERQVRYLFQNDLLSVLLCIPTGSFSLRTRAVHHFMCLAEPNRDVANAGLPVSFLLEDLSSPRVLVEKSLSFHPYWVSSFLLATAVAGCPQPVEVEVLDEFIFKQLSILSCFSDEVRRAFVPGGVESNNGANMINEDCAISALTALKTCAAYYRWRGEIPYRNIGNPDFLYTSGRTCDVSHELCFSFFQLLYCAESSWLNALESSDWGIVLLAILVSFAVMYIEGEASMGHVEEAHDHLFSATVRQDNKERDILCRFVVTHAKKCDLFLSQLFGILRKSTITGSPFSRCVISFFCHCIYLAVGEGVSISSTFIRLLLAQHLTPLLLYLETPAFAGDVARLLALALAHLPINVASCCDHTLFRWAMKHVNCKGAKVYAWQVVFFLLERLHGSEFALRHELELEAKLRAGNTGELPSHFVAALLTVQWLVGMSMRRRGVHRLRAFVPAPTGMWAQSSSQHALLRAFIISTVERHTREFSPDEDLLRAAPMLLEWGNEMFARCHIRVTVARLLYALTKARSQLSASLEALGLFLQLTTTTTTSETETETSARQTDVLLHFALVEEQAWVYAALLLSWPPWGMSAGLKAAVDAFLTSLEIPERTCLRAKRSREEETDIVDMQEMGARRAVEALVEACEHQSECQGEFPLNRAKDFFIQKKTKRPDVDATQEVVFTTVCRDCELFVLC